MRKTGAIRVAIANVILWHEVWAALSTDSKTFAECFLPNDLRDIARYWSAIKDELWYRL